MSRDFSRELEPTSLLDISAEMAAFTNEGGGSVLESSGSSLREVSLLPDMSATMIADTTGSEAAVEAAASLHDESADSLVGVSILQLDDSGAITLDNDINNANTSRGDPVVSPVKQRKVAIGSSTPMTPIANTDNSLCDISYNDDGSAIIDDDDDEQRGSGGAAPVRDFTSGVRDTPGSLQDFVGRSLHSADETDNDELFLPARTAVEAEAIDEDSINRLDFNAAAYIRALKKASVQSNRSSRSSGSRTPAAPSSSSSSPSFAPAEATMREVTDRFNSVYWRRRLQYRSMASVLNSLDFKIYAMRKLVS